MSIVLPTPESNSGANEWSDVYSNDKALKEAVEELQGEVTELKGITHPVTWYTPKVIATEETRSNTSFGTLTTADEITGIEVPANGLLDVSYTASVKSSSGGKGTAALFIGSTQVPVANILGTNVLNSQLTEAEAFTRFSLDDQAEDGWRVDVGWNSGVSTGRVVRSFKVGELAAGTYAVAVKFKASTGSVTAKERKLMVAALGS